MKLKNILIVVKDIERSKQFYHDLFGLEMVLDNDGNMILTEGLVLQEEQYWKAFLGADVIPRNNASELYFEEPELEAFVEKLERVFPSVQYVNRLMGIPIVNTAPTPVILPAASAEVRYEDDGAGISE